MRRPDDGSPDDQAGAAPAARHGPWSDVGVMVRLGGEIAAALEGGIVAASDGAEQRGGQGDDAGIAINGLVDGSGQA